MSKAADKQMKGEPEIVVDETRSDPPVQGPSNIVKVISKKGKIHIVKREGDVEVETEVEAEKPDLREFKLRPVQNLDLASHRKYEVVGITMESKYDDLTESDEEREVAKLTKMEQAAHKEMKHLMVIQGCLKGQIPGFAAGIHAYVTGRYPGVPSELAKPYVIPEHGHKADLLDRIPPIQVEHFLQEHDRSIPRRDVVIRPGRKGISMSIDPNSDDEVYKINEMEDSLETVIRLTKPKETEEGKSAETPSAEIPATETAPKAAETAGKDKEERVLVTDVISQEMADEYTKEEELEEEESSDAETISSTSTADFDRDEVEELLNQLSTCQSALSVHYNKLNELVPHMTNAQVANYLGKAHIMPLVKVESGSVSKVYVEEDTDEEHKFVVRGDTHEEKLKGLVETVPAHRLMLAIAIGDVHLNSLSYAQASQKYEFSKSRIQRGISGKSEHKKGGKQYKQEKKRKAAEEADTSPKEKKAKQDEEVPVRAVFPAPDVESDRPQETLPDLTKEQDEDFPDVDIDA